MAQTIFAIHIPEAKTHRTFIKIQTGRLSVDELDSFVFVCDLPVCVSCKKRDHSIFCTQAQDFLTPHWRYIKIILFLIRLFHEQGLEESVVLIGALSLLAQQLRPGL